MRTREGASSQGVTARAEVPPPCKLGVLVAKHALEQTELRTAEERKDRTWKESATMTQNEAKCGPVGPALGDGHPPHEPLRR